MARRCCFSWSGTCQRRATGLIMQEVALQTGHISVDGDAHTAHCRLCPSWHPTFDGPLAHIEADDCLSAHLLNAHNIEAGSMKPGTPVYDLVFVLRIATPIPEVPEHLASIIGALIKQAVHNPSLVEMLGIGMTHGTAFIKPLSPDVLDLRLTPEMVTEWLRTWNGDPLD